MTGQTDDPRDELAVLLRKYRAWKIEQRDPDYSMARGYIGGQFCERIAALRERIKRNK